MCACWPICHQYIGVCIVVLHTPTFFFDRVLFLQLAEWLRRYHENNNYTSVAVTSCRFLSGLPSHATLLNSLLLLL